MILGNGHLEITPGGRLVLIQESEPPSVRHYKVTWFKTDEAGTIIRDGSESGSDLQNLIENVDAITEGKLRFHPKR